jgi:hypothetical protein
MPIKIEHNSPYKKLQKTDPTDGEVVYVIRGNTYKGASFHYEKTIVGN